MPEHTSFLTYLVHMLPNGGELAKEFGHGVIAQTPPSWQSWEPPITAARLIIILLALGSHARAKYAKLDNAVVPEDKLSIRTFFEVFLGYFYGMARDVMGPERAKRYFPIIGAASCFVFFGNVVGLIPGLMIPANVEPKHHVGLRALGLRPVQLLRRQGQRHWLLQAHVRTLGLGQLASRSTP